MHIIKKCSEVNDQQIFEAFREGFSDYIIKFNMDKPTFINRFFGAEGNDRKYSFIALKNNKLVGIVLGGIKTGECLKTLRCGGMAVVACERGTGVAKDLMQHHEQLAKELNCKQLFLEVLSNNDRAIKFYKKLNYEIIYNLTYRKLELTDSPFKDVNVDIYNKIEDSSYNEILKLRKVDLSHLPWQGQFTYFKESPAKYYCYKQNNKIIAGLVATKDRIIYIWVHPNYRLQGIAKALLKKSATDLNSKTWRAFYANNSLLHTFCNKLNMKFEQFSQYEMYKLLK